MPICSQVRILNLELCFIKFLLNLIYSNCSEFPDAPVTFVLTRGSGPVHIHGQHLTGDFDNMEDDLDDEALDDEEDTDNEIRADEEEEPKPKKAKLAGNNVVKKEKNNKKK